jgi:hypothetical protein
VPPPRRPRTAPEVDDPARTEKEREAHAAFGDRPDVRINRQRRPVLGPWHSEKGSPAKLSLLQERRQARSTANLPKIGREGVTPNGHPPFGVLPSISVEWPRIHEHGVVDLASVRIIRRRACRSRPPAS